MMRLHFSLLLLASLSYAQTQCISCAGESTVGVGVFSQYALQFTKANTTNVDHGPFWAPNTNYSPIFLWEAWVNRSANNPEYIISDGYGGAHDVLFGFTGNSGTLTGNTWDGIGNTAISFGSFISVPANEWHYVAVGGDGTNITTYLDGCPVGQIAYSNVRNTLGLSGSGGLFIGGSNHSNYDGLIRQVRGWENGYNPAYDVNLSAGCFNPELNLSRSSMYNRTGATLQQASFIADYSVPQSVIADLSNGVQSANTFKHNGKLGNTATGELVQEWNGGNGSRDSAFPSFVETTFTQPAYSGPVPDATPINAVAYDQFRRADSTYAWNNVPSLGTAPTGQAWTTVNGTCGIQQQTMLCNGIGTVDVSLLSIGKATQDITVAILGGTYSPSASVQHISVYANYVDSSNYVWATTSGGLFSTGKVTAGVNTWYSGCSGLSMSGTPATSIEITLSGTSLTSKLNGLTKCSQTDGALPGGFNVGIGLADPLVRVSKVTVF